MNGGNIMAARQFADLEPDNDDRSPEDIAADEFDCMPQSEKDELRARGVTYSMWADCRVRQIEYERRMLAIAMNEGGRDD